MALTIVQIAEQLLPKLLPGVAKETDLTPALLATELAKPANAALKTDFDSNGDVDKADQLLAATKSRFGVVTQEHIDTKIKAPINSKTHEYNLLTGEAEITLNGLTGVKLTTPAPGVTIVSEGGDKLKIKIDPTAYTDGTPIKLEGTYKGKTVTLDTVVFKPKDVVVPKGTLGTDGSVILTFPADLTDAQITTLGGGDTFKAEKVAGNAKQVKISLKDGKSITADTQLPEIEFTINGRTIKQKATISKAGTAPGAEEEKGGIGASLLSHWKGLVGVVGLIVAFFLPSDEEQGYLKTIIAAAAGILGGWDLFGSGGWFGPKAEEAPEAAKP